MSKQAFERIAKDMVRIVELQIQGNKPEIARLQAEMKAFYLANVEQSAENHKRVDALYSAARGPSPEAAIAALLADLA